MAALSENHVIGIDGHLPWHLPNDLKRFKQLTIGEHVVMGRKTFDSIGKALPRRHNIVLTHDPHFVAPGVEVVHQVDEILHRDYERVFVIGGEEIFRAFLPHSTKLYLTWVHVTLKGDAFFPTFNDFVVISKIRHAPDEHHTYSYSFVDYERAYH